MKTYKMIKKKPEPQPEPATTTESDIEIGDVENFRSDKMQVFNHQELVRIAHTKLIESLNCELRDGWFDEKVDRNGNVIRTYVESTREKFFQTLEACECVMACDLDAEAKKNISELRKRLADKKDMLLKEQEKWFYSLSPRIQRETLEKQGPIMNSELNINLMFYGYLIKCKEQIYKEIFKELVMQTSRLDFYQVEEFVG